MSVRPKIVSIVPALAVLATGAFATAPAQAATTSVTAATAGTKAVGATTYMWGTTNAPAGATICSQVVYKSAWTTSTCSSVKADHSYAVELTYGKNNAGTYTFRAITGGVASPAVTLQRTSGSSVPSTPAPTTPSTPTPPASGSTTMYTTGTVNVRSGAGTSYSVVTTLGAKTQVTGTVSGTWLKIATPSNLAGKYVSTTVLTATAPAGSTVPTTPSTPAASTATRYTYSTSTNVRSSASTSAAVVATLPVNTKVTGTVSGSWLKIATPSNLAGKYVSTTVLGSTSPAGTDTVSSTKGLIYDDGVLGNAYTLYTGYNGVKVYLAMKALGMPVTPTNTTMSDALMTKLKGIQSAHGWTADGVLDEKTWNALGAKDKDGVAYPFTIDSWAKTSDVMDDAPRDVRVAAMISFAKEQLGKPYIWGGTGPMGFDCAGLLIQAARAGGMKPAAVSNFIDVSQASNLSDSMMRDGEFQKGSTASLHPGDFIYFGGINGVAHHVGMYVGGGQMINAATTLNAQGVAISGQVRYDDVIKNGGWKYQLGVNRAFAL